MSTELKRVRLVINVDDDEMARDGVRSVLTKQDPDLEIVDLTFSEALGRTDWQGVDYAIVDLSHNFDDDPAADEYPGVGVVRHVAEMAPGRGPHIIVITGEYGAHDNELVMRRVKEAGAQYLLYRTDFWRHLSNILNEAGPVGITKLADTELNEPGLGVRRYSRLNEALDAIRGSAVLNSKLRGGTGQNERTRIQAAGKLEAVDADGNPSHHVVARRQISRIHESAARLPRRRHKP